MIFSGVIIIIIIIIIYLRVKNHSILHTVYKYRKKSNNKIKRYRVSPKKKTSP
jgi:hypothetical protein